MSRIIGSQEFWLLPVVPGTAPTVEASAPSIMPLNIIAHASARLTTASKRPLPLRHRLLITRCSFNAVLLCPAIASWQVTIPNTMKIMKIRCQFLLLKQNFPRHPKKRLTFIAEKTKKSNVKDCRSTLYGVQTSYSKTILKR